MAEGLVSNITITGIACAVPDQLRDAETFYEQFGQEAVEKFVNMTGVKRVCQSIKEQTASDLAYVAAETLINEKNIDRSTIGSLIFVSQGPDYRLPATAFVLQHRLGLPEGCICFDVNLGCSGYVYGLSIVASLMSCSNIKRAMLLVGDTSTKGISSDDKASAMLFGDAGSATILEKKEDTSMHYMFRSDGDKFKAIINPAGAYRNINASTERVVWPIDGNLRSDYETYMNGTDVFVFTMTEVPRSIKEFFSKTNTSVDDYDCFALHQANLYILRQIAKKIDIPPEKMPISIDRYGNTSVTSLPLTLSDAYGDDSDGDLRLFLCGFGVGLSWGIVSTIVKKADILPVIFTNDYYEDGSVAHA